MKSVNANKINRKSGEAEGPAVSLSGATKARKLLRYPVFPLAFSRSNFV